MKPSILLEGFVAAEYPNPEKVKPLNSSMVIYAPKGERLPTQPLRFSDLGCHVAFDVWRGLGFRILVRFRVPCSLRFWRV